MVKTLSQLYLETRRLLSEADDLHTASLVSRNLLCHVTGKTPEELMRDMQMYASAAVTEQLDALVNRVRSTLR